MNEKIKELERGSQSSTPKKGQIEGADVVRAIEKGFKEHVRPTWSEWKKQASASVHIH